MSIINKKTGIRGYTIDGGGSYPIDEQGRVKRCIFAYKYHYHVNDVVCNVSRGTDDWGAQMGDGSIIPLSNPIILYQARNNSIIQFDMNDPYPSNSPCVLVYRSDQAYINIDITDNPAPFSVNSVSGNFAITVDRNNSDERGRVNTLIAVIDYPQQHCDIQFEISTDPSHWGARMGDGSIISLRDPKVISTNTSNAVVQFNMDTAYPSNSPCVLVYRSDQAYYIATPINGQSEFVPVSSVKLLSTTMIASDSMDLKNALIEPADSTEQDIIWSVISGPATLSGKILTSTGSGNAVIRAIVKGGGPDGADFTQDITVDIQPNVITVTMQPHPECKLGDTICTSATSTVGVVSYQWYVSNTNSTDGVAISGATSDTYTIPQSGGNKYYYCKVSSPCASDVNTSICGVPIPLSLMSISITPNTSIFNLDGTTHQYQAVLTPSNYPGKIQWSISNTDVAGIEPSGILTPISAGTAVITVTELTTKMSAQKTITVNPYISVDDISGVISNIETSTQYSLSATVSPANATYKTIQWSIVDAGSTGLTIDSAGKMTASVSGVATIRATINKGISVSTDYSQDFVVHVAKKNVFVPVQDIQITGININDYQNTGDTLNFSPVVVPSNATSKNVTFTLVSGDASVFGSSMVAHSAGTVRIRATVTNGAGTINNMQPYTKEFEVKVKVKVQIIPIQDVSPEFMDVDGNSTGIYLRTQQDQILPLLVYPDVEIKGVKYTLKSIQSGIYSVDANETDVSSWETDTSGAVDFNPATGAIDVHPGYMGNKTLYKVNINVRITDGLGENKDFVKDTYFIVVGLTDDAFVPLTNVDIILPSRLRCYYPILVTQMNITPVMPSVLDIDTMTLNGVQFNTYWTDEDQAVNTAILDPQYDLIYHTIDPLPIFIWGMMEKYLYPWNPGKFVLRVKVPNAAAADPESFDQYNPVLKDYVKDIPLEIEDPFIPVKSITNIPTSVESDKPLVLSPEILTGKGLDCYNPYWDEEEATYQTIKWSVIQGSAKIVDGVLTAYYGSIKIRATIENGVDEDFSWYPYQPMQQVIDSYNAASKDNYGRPWDSDLGAYTNPVYDKSATPPWSPRNVSVPYVQDFTLTVYTTQSNGDSISLILSLLDGTEIEITKEWDYYNLCNDKPSDAEIPLSDNRSFVKNQVVSIEFVKWNNLQLKLKNFARNFTSLTSITGGLPNIYGGESSMEGFLWGCTAFNQTITVPSRVTGKNSMKNFLRDCTSFNSTITLPDGLTGESCMHNFLRGCTAFNKPITIPDGVTGKNCLRSFLQGCKSFNQALSIPAGVQGWGCLYEFLSECTRFNRPLTLPDDVMDPSDPGREMCNFMRSCDLMTNTITVPKQTGVHAEVSEQVLSSRHLRSNLSQMGVYINGDGASDFLAKVSNKYDTEEWPYTHYRNLDY